jgi:hypothetical protein
LWEFCIGQLPSTSPQLPSKDVKGKEAKGELFTFLTTLQQHSLTPEKDRWNIQQLVRDI